MRRWMSVGVLAALSFLAVEPSVADTAESLLQQEIASASIVCQSPKDCPSYVGMAMWITQKESSYFVETCTVELVSPTRILTNSHCIPDRVKADPSLCEAELAFKFPEVKREGIHRPETVAACGRLIYSSPLSAHETSSSYLREPDVAIVELKEPIAGLPIRLSRSGLPEGELLTSYVVTPPADSDEPEATPAPPYTIEKRTCSVRQGTVFLPSFTHASSDVGTVIGQGCHIEEGNSGAGLFNQAGQLVGLVYGFVVSPETRAEFLGYKADGSKQSVVFVTNFACLDVVKEFPIANIGTSCSESVRSQLAVQGRAGWQEKSQAHSNDTFQEAVGEWQKTLPADFLYAFDTRDIQQSPKVLMRFVSLEMGCFQRKSKELIRALASEDHAFSVDYTEPVFRAESRADENFRPYFRWIHESSYQSMALLTETSDSQLDGEYLRSMMGQYVSVGKGIVRPCLNPPGSKGNRKN